jgi:uncharacterized protein HemX
MRVLRVVLTLLMLAGGGAAPAAAQIMKPDGFAIPWFHSPAERQAREACEQNLPECRASVRREIAKEKAATVITPWLLFGVAILGVLLWMRSQEKKKEKRRLRAQRHHDPAAYRRLDKTREEREAEIARERERML